MNRILFLFFALSLFSLQTNCKSEKNQTIRITGNVMNIHAAKLYIYHFYDPQIPFDSTLISNNKFNFEFKSSESFEPHSVYLSYFDTTENFKRKNLIYLNEFTQHKGKNIYYSNFILEKGLTKISGDMLSKEKLHIKGGIETTAKFETELVDFGFYDSSSSNAANTLNYYRKIIQKYPTSFILFKQIVNNRTSYPISQLSNLIKLFENRFNNTSTYLLLNDYLSRKSAIKPITNLQVKTEQNIPIPLYDTSSKLNLIIVWASWCHPCRLEIPELKKIYQKYSALGLNMNSISIDTDLKDWKRALSEEKMPWPQGITPNENLIKLFDHSAIPLSVLIDKKGFEIKRYTGFDKKNTTNLDSTINTFLTKL